MCHVHQLSAFTISLWGVWICLTVFSVYIESTLDQKSGITNFSYIFLMLLLYSPGLCTADVSPTGNEGKLKLREFKMILANSLMRAGKSTSTKRGRPSLSDVEKELQAKKRRSPEALVSTKAIRLDDLDHWPVFMENGKKGNVKIQVARLLQK